VILTIALPVIVIYYILYMVRLVGLFVDLTFPPHKSTTRGPAGQTAAGERNIAGPRYIHLELTSLENVRPWCLTVRAAL
jgi:hypothetical protein